jgi:hypothetical protein
MPTGRLGLGFHAVSHFATQSTIRASGAPVLGDGLNGIDRYRSLVEGGHAILDLGANERTLRTEPIRPYLSDSQ